MLNLTPWMLLAPLAGFVVLGVVGRWLPRPLIALIGCGTILVAFVLAVVNFFSLLGVPLAGRSGDIVVWQWLTAGVNPPLAISFGLLYDQLAGVMLLVVTGVGFLIHVYSIGYMEGDPGFWRFFSFLNLFVFTMTLLVSADNFLFLLVGWAGVGLASFLLIGFWYTRPSAVAAAQKAFVVNVIGDFGLMLAIFLLFKHYGSLDYRRVLPTVCPGHCPPPLSAPFAVNGGTIIAITLLLFVAAAAKSAQFPLHVWLPDAMEGPTPVSALIHAATMVTAGVYLVARAAPLFNQAPTSLAVVAGIGGFTAIFAATIACVQTDIKRILAYSTMSQLGYMFLAEGAGGYSAGIFHLTTHAYFKALLFMAAGGVIHALAGEQDLRRMGGLRQKLPITFWTFVAGGLALAAIVPFAGFWSKDDILSVVWQRALSDTSGNAGWWYLLYAVGLATALLTGFYIFRLIFGAFLGSYRGPEIAAAHDATASGPPAHAAAGASASGPSPRTGRAGRGQPAVHEVGLAMSIPMVILALLSLIGGFDGLPGNDVLGDLLAPVTGISQTLAPGSGLFFLSLGLGLLAAVLGIAIAWARYGRGQRTFAPSPNPLYQFLAHKWYFDELYSWLLVRPILWLGRGTNTVLEGVTLDGGSRGLGWLTGRVSAGLRALQTGYVRNYALGILLGAVVILIYFLAVGRL